jgi:hypothetical protein
MIPRGSGLGNVGAGLQPLLLAALASRIVVLMDEITLYRTKAASGHKINLITECIVREKTIEKMLYQPR